MYKILSSPSSTSFLVRKFTRYIGEAVAKPDVFDMLIVLRPKENDTTGDYKLITTMA